MLYYYLSLLFLAIQILLSFLFRPEKYIPILFIIGIVFLIFGFILIIISYLIIKRKSAGTDIESFYKNFIFSRFSIYGYVRHPQELGFIFISSAIVLFSQHIFVIIAGALTILCVIQKVNKDKETLLEKFPNEYKKYIKEVPALNIILGFFRKKRQRH